MKENEIYQLKDFDINNLRNLPPVSQLILGRFFPRYPESSGIHDSYVYSSIGGTTEEELFRPFIKDD